MSMDEAIRRFPDEWIIMRITEGHAGEVTMRGEVVEHGLDDARIVSILREAILSPEPGRGPLYLFHGSPVARTGEEVRAALAQAEVADGVGAWREW
jgi:hypothetical protein